jgi:hypothetical protein
VTQKSSPKDIILQGPIELLFQVCIVSVAFGNDPMGLWDIINKHSHEYMMILLIVFPEIAVSYYSKPTHKYPFKSPWENNSYSNNHCMLTTASYFLLNPSKTDAM